MVSFSQSVTIPGVPISEDETLTDWLFKPVETEVAKHHIAIMEALQRCIETEGGRLMIFAPPGSAKSSYAAVVAPAWAMGKNPGFRVILTSYAATPAERQSRRCRALVASPEYQAIWPNCSLRQGASGVTEWELMNDAGMLAAGILGAITSARADLLIVDDPVANREEADSETIRRKIKQEFEDSLMTRLKPGASIVIIQTRWHMDDLSGGILPEDYDGESGPILCRDGQVWEVLNIPAKAERADDPIGREPGEYLWPEWFTLKHWSNYEGNMRTWSSLYQQRPVPDTGGQFEREWFKWYEPHELPKHLMVYGSSDLAVTKKTLKTNPDFSEHGIWGVDEVGELWGLDWWFGQKDLGATIDAQLSLVKQWGPREWFDEKGVIKNAAAPLLALKMREAKVYMHIEYLPASEDKIARVASFRGRASAGLVHLPKGAAWAARLVDQLCSFPFARYDDAVDTCGNIGRGLDQLAKGRKPEEEKTKVVKPFTKAWLEHNESELTDDEIHEHYT